MQAQVQTLGSDFEIVGIRAWDEYPGVEFNVYPGREEAFAVAGHKLYFEVTVRNNTDRWQVVYLDITVGGLTSTYGLTIPPHGTATHRSSWPIDSCYGRYTFKLYKNATVYQTVSAYAFRIWGGNYHLPGDVNFDGFINMEDLDLVKAQLGRTSDDVWGTGSDQYDPNRDLDMDGVISDRDAYVVRKLLGWWTEWDCLTHPNPSMINNGEGWTITDSDMTGETWCGSVIPGVRCFPGYSIDFSATFYANKRGFKLQFSTVAGELGSGGFVELDFTSNAHFGHNPDDWNKVLPGDIPLSQLADYKFIVEGQLHDWYRYVPGYTMETTHTWLAWCFGGWVILSKPYEVWACTASIAGGEEFLNTQNILEPMFWIKQHKDGQAISPGGDEWHRIFYRKGFKGLEPDKMKSGWFILGYTLADPKKGETVRVELTGEKILQLLKTLEGKERIYQKNPIFPGNYIVKGINDFFIKNLSFENAYFRPVYFSLEGGVDNGAIGYMQAVGGSVSFYGVYLYRRKRGVVWQPKLSPTVQVEVKR